MSKPAASRHSRAASVAAPRHDHGHDHDHDHDHAHAREGAHDHAVCLGEARQRAAQAFDAKGMKLTPLRRLVFEEIAGSHDAVGAYDVLDRLVRKTGERMAPVSVYRAIDALLEAGVVHRLESRNAFYACHNPAHGRHIAMVCNTCGAVTELAGSDLHGGIERAAASAGFAVASIVVEVAGLCAPCTGGTGKGSAP
jgi:Fur family transcriptional regulator, zinc uptake regulator